MEDETLIDGVVCPVPILESILDLLGVGLGDVPHLRTRFAGLVWGELAVWFGDLDVGWHVTVRTGQGGCLDTSWRELSLQGLALATLLTLLLPAHAVALETLPLQLRVLSWWHPLVEVHDGSLKQLLFLFLFLLEFQSL